MAAPKTALSQPGVPPGGSQISDLYNVTERLKTLSVDLFNALENDETAYDMASRAGEIARISSNLEDVFNNIGGALQNLGS